MSLFDVMKSKVTEFDESDLKPKFVERFKSFCPDFDAFVKFSFTFLNRSIRVNTIKISVADLKKRLEVKGWTLTQIPWCKEGFWIKSERRDIGNLVEHTLGYIYVQEAASMIPPVVLDPKPGEKVLDMCASPGSKASQIAQYMENKGILIANDFKGDRIKPLGINFQRMGISNSIITLMTGQRFRGLEFDRILVDAPCSGTGTIRKSLKTITIWNPTMITRLSSTQKQLVDTAWSVLKKGGTLVYSTCSLEPEEDEEVVDYLLKQHSDARIEDIVLDIKRSPAIVEFEKKKYSDEVKKCLRLWPQDNDTEGFFVAKIKKV